MKGPGRVEGFEEGWPARDVDLHALAVFVVAEEGLEVLPAVEGADFAAGGFLGGGVSLGGR